MAFGATRFGPRTGPVGTVSDLLVVAAAARKLARRRGRASSGRSGARGMVDTVELALAAAAAVRLARQVEAYRRRRATRP